MKFFKFFTEIGFEEYNWQWTSNSSNDGLGMMRRQAIDWIDNEPVHVRVYKSPRPIVLNNNGLLISLKQETIFMVTF